MRLGECLALQHRDWHLGRGVTPYVEVVPRQDHPLGLRVKGGRARRIHISDQLEHLYGEWVWSLCDAGDDVEAARWCQRLGRDGDLDAWYVFVNSRRGERMAPLAPSSVYERVRTVKRHVGERTPADWTPHWFRHTHASSLLLAGAPAPYVSRRLGHADVMTTLDLYGWVSEDAELAALDWRRLASTWSGGDDDWRPGALIKVAAEVSAPFEEAFHRQLLVDRDGIPTTTTRIGLGHPLRGGFDVPERRQAIHLGHLPDTVRVEMLWWAKRSLTVGTAITGSAANWLDTNWGNVSDALTGDGRPPPCSFLERTHQEWMAAVRKVRVRLGAPLKRMSLDAHLNALVGRLCHSLQITCLPWRWWEHDLWVPDMDGRIPLRVVEPRARATCSWAKIPQPWLRPADKWHVRVGLETGRFGWSSVLRKAECLTRLGQFLAEAGIDDPLLVAEPEAGLPALALDFLSWLQRQPNRFGGQLSRSFCRDVQSAVGTFYADLFTHRAEVATTLGDQRWRSLTPFHGTVLSTAHRLRLPRFRDRLDGFEPEVFAAINAQVELIGLPKDQTRTVLVDGQPSDVAGIGDPQAMRIYLLLLRLGRRASEVLLLDRDPLLPLAGFASGADQGGFVARLRYAETKIDGAPDTIPVEADVVAIIREQQDWLDERERILANDGRSRWLFVRPHQNRLGLAPYSYSTLLRRIERLQAALQLKDSQGNTVPLTRMHRLRHTKATSLLNAGVALTVIQRYLGHVTPNMTAHYAKLRDHTIRDAFLALEKLRADGSPSPVAAGDLYEVLQLDSRTDRILPDGWSLLPPRQVCEKGNACLTCDLFVTDQSHVDTLSQQRAATAALIDPRRQEFAARFGEPMSDEHVWLEPRLRESRALDRLLSSLQTHDGPVRGGGVAGRWNGASTLVPLTRKPAS